MGNCHTMVEPETSTRAVLPLVSSHTASPPGHGGPVLVLTSPKMIVPSANPNMARAAVQSSSNRSSLSIVNRRPTSDVDSACVTIQVPVGGVSPPLMRTSLPLRARNSIRPRDTVGRSTSRRISRAIAAPAEHRVPASTIVAPFRSDRRTSPQESPSEKTIEPSVRGATKATNR